MFATLQIPRGGGKGQGLFLLPSISFYVKLALTFYFAQYGLWVPWKHQI